MGILIWNSPDTKSLKVKLLWVKNNQLVLAKWRRKLKVAKWKQRKVNSMAEKEQQSVGRSMDTLDSLHNIRSIDSALSLSNKCWLLLLLATSSSSVRKYISRVQELFTFRCCYLTHTETCPICVPFGLNDRVFLSLMPWPPWNAIRREPETSCSDRSIGGRYWMAWGGNL